MKLRERIIGFNASQAVVETPVISIDKKVIKCKKPFHFPNFIKKIPNFHLIIFFSVSFPREYTCKKFLVNKSRVEYGVLIFFF